MSQFVPSFCIFIAVQNKDWSSEKKTMASVRLYRKYGSSSIILVSLLILLSLLFIIFILLLLLFLLFLIYYYYQCYY